MPGVESRVLAWVVVGNERYGVRRATLGLVGALAELGWDITILALERGPMSEECLALGLEVRHLNVGIPATYAGSLFDRARVLAALHAYSRRAAGPLISALDAVRPQVVHVRAPTAVALAGHAGRQVGASVVWQMPNVIGSGYPLSLNRLVYQITCFRYGVIPLANSAYTGRTLGRWPVVARTFHLGVDERQFDPSTVAHVSREELGIPKEAIVLGMCGRVTRDKGQDRVLRAMLATTADAPLHLVLVGGVMEPGFGEVLVAEARGHGAEDRLHVLGAVANPECYYELTDIQINARVDAEPFGLSVVEAMMMRRPVLVHALGGPAETVLDGTTGWHVADVGDRSMQAGLARALRERGRWEDMGLAARRHAVEQFSVRARAREYSRLVGALEGGRPRRSR